MTWPTFQCSGTALHETARGFLRIAQRLLDRGAVVGLHPLKNRLLLVRVEVLDQSDRVVGFQLARDIRDLLRLHLVDKALADPIVHLGEHFRVDDSGERLDEPLALVARGRLDQVGDVGRVQRLNELARGFVVAGVDSVQNALDELGPEPVLLVDRAGVSRVRLGHDRGGDLVVLGHFAPLD